jgi:TolB-like protein/Flp pilus assembly protein TadD
MPPDTERFRLELLGAFRLFAPDGSRIPVKSKRSRILLAMLATARSGERSRLWLEERLWGDRARPQAQASLRRELSNLRSLLNGPAPPPLLLTDRETVALNLGRIVVDVRDRGRAGEVRGEFLEGVDIAADEAFEDWLREERQAIAKARDEAMAAAAARPDPGQVVDPFAGRPSISVLVQQQNLSPENAVLIEGVAEDLADRLARLRWLPLVGAPLGALRIDGNEAVTRAGRLLNVDYLLHCRLGLGRNFTLTLSETSSGRLLWSRRYDLGDPVAASDIDRVATDAVAALSMLIETDQQQRVRDRVVQGLTPDELVWRARWHMRRLTREDARIAEDLLEMAIRARPASAEVMIERGYAEAWKLWAAGAGAAPIEALRQRMALARDMDPYDARGHLLLGILDLWLSRHESAEALMREAIALNPSLSSAYGQLGSCLSLSGRADEGLELLRTALRLNPLDTQNFHQFGELALAQLMLGDFAAAIVEADHALARRPAYLYGHVLKTAALWMAGEQERWLEARAALRRIKPDYDPAALEWLPFRDRSWNRRLQQALAGGQPVKAAPTLAVC